MIFHKTTLPDAYIVELTAHSDARGHFARVWCRQEFAKHGLATDFVQGNMSINPKAGTLRGMHYQTPPHGEVKLIRCVRGAIYDVIVDMRPSSPAYRQWIGVELTPATFRMLYAPAGFAHGFLTLVDDTEVSYLVSSYYAPKAGVGIRYDDPAIGISWPRPIVDISAQDQGWPLLEPTVAETAPVRGANPERASVHP